MIERNRGREEGCERRNTIERQKSYSVHTVGFLMVFWDTIGFVHNKASGFQFGHGFRVSEGE